MRNFNNEPERPKNLGWHINVVRGFEILPGIWVYRYYLNKLPSLEMFAIQFIKPYSSLDAI